MKTLEVGPAGAYTVFYWIRSALVTTVVAIPTMGLGLILLPVFLWHKKAVINRTKIMVGEGARHADFKHGRWFIADEDQIPLKSIDNIKVDHSILGKIFGWCTLVLETRSENYELRHVCKASAKEFKDYCAGYA